jgi:hypothetical protein
MKGFPKIEGTKDSKDSKTIEGTKDSKTKIVVGEGLKDRTGYIDKEGNRVMKGNDGSNLVVREKDRRTHELNDVFIGGDHVFKSDTLVGGPNSWGMTEKAIKHHQDRWGSKIYEGKTSKKMRNKNQD